MADKKIKNTGISMAMLPNNEVSSDEELSPSKDRSYHPNFIKKRKVRVKVRLSHGINCFGDCHVLWPDGRTSDVINDNRSFLLLTNATVEEEPNTYDILTLNKNNITMIFEIHRYGLNEG